jgi:hypothetical protein
MKKHIRSLASAAVGMALALALVSCGGGSKSKKNDEPVIGGGPGVYVAANAYYSQTLQCAVVFKDGALLQRLSQEYTTARSVFVSGDDVYVAGCTGEPYGGEEGGPYRARLWKNGVQQELQNSSNADSMAGSVFVSGDDVYVAGWVVSGDGYRATLWKNGVATQLSNNSSTAWSVFVSGSNVYVSGDSEQGATLWTNSGTPQYTASHFVGEVANSVYVSGSGVYCAGQARDNSQQHAYRAAYWKDGTLQNLQYNNMNIHSNAWSVFASGSDVYVAGGEEVGNDSATARLWRNGAPQNLQGLSSDSYAFSVYVSGGNVYVAGNNENPQNHYPRITLWKDGAPSYLTGSGILAGYATSVFVKQP